MLNMRLVEGTVPAKGTVIELCRSNFGPGDPSVIEDFEADGEWVAPRTENGFYYRASTKEAIDAYMRREYGVG